MTSRNLVSCFSRKTSKLLPPDVRLRVYGGNAPNSISAGAPIQTPLGELTALPQTPLAGFKRAYFSANLFTVDARRVVLLPCSWLSHGN